MNGPDPHLRLQHGDADMLHVLGFAPLLALTGSLRTAATICALFLVLHAVCLPGTRALGSLVPARLHLALAVVVCALATAVLLQGMLWWQYALTRDLGIYLPLLAINATLYLNILRGLAAATTAEGLRGALPGVMSLCAATLLIAGVRTLLDGHFAALATPFGALITLSLILAGTRAWRLRATTTEPAPP